MRETRSILRCVHMFRNGKERLYFTDRKFVPISLDNMAEVVECGLLRATNTGFAGVTDYGSFLVRTSECDFYYEDISEEVEF